MSTAVTTKRARGGFLRGAAVIAAGGFLAKLIGALYRIPLTNLIGGYGVGLYQLVYPFYCLLLTVSATGIPSSVARLTAKTRAEGNSTKPLFKTALWLFCLIGGVGTLLMVLLAPLLSRAQDNPALTSGYIALAPAVLLTSAISVFRGWFQGRNAMTPTAVSEVVEQIVKVGFGLCFAYFYRADTLKAVTMLLLSVSISEAVALVGLIVAFTRVSAPFEGQNAREKVSAKSVLKTSIPVTFASALLPLSNLLDSVLLVRLMGRYTQNAVALYGLFSGGAVTLINLPVSVCYGIAAALVPANASSGEDERGGKEAKRRLGFALFVTVLISLPCAIGLALFAPLAVRLVFHALTRAEQAVLVRLVRIFAVSAVTLSCVQTLSASLTGLGNPARSAHSMAVAVVVKTALEVLLVSRPVFSVYGAAIAADACYLVAFFLDLWYNLKECNKRLGRNYDEKRE